MRIGLIADTHIPEARPSLWPQVFDAFRGVDAILHAGDLHELHVLDALAEVAPVWAARGNGEDGSGGRPAQPDHPNLREAWVIELGPVRVGLTHDLPVPAWSTTYTLDVAMERYFGTTEIDVAVFGHSHVELIESVGRTLCVNPGSPTFPHNLSTQLGTVGFLDISDAGTVEASIWQLTDHGVEPFDWARWRR